MTHLRPTSSDVTDAGQAHALGNVADDWEAAAVWLAVLQARPVSLETFKTYRREVRRLHWYCQTQAVPMPSTWSYQDALRYVAFLNNESGTHIGPRLARYGDADWTPFRRALSPSAVADVRKILHTLFKWWMDSGYARFNPFAGQAGRAPGTTQPSRRALPPHLTDRILSCLDEREKENAHDYRKYYRDRFVFLLFLQTGIRAHEAAAADMADIGPLSDPKTRRDYWALRLRTQKGGGEGTVLLDALVMDALRRYRQAFNLSPVPEFGESGGLILSTHTVRGLGRPAPKARQRNAQWKEIRTRQGVWLIIKGMLNDAAAAAGHAGDGASAAMLARASTHWLRHTRATSLLLKNVDLRIVAKALRHKKISTTMLYTDLDILDVARAIDG